MTDTTSQRAIEESFEDYARRFATGVGLLGRLIERSREQCDAASSRDLQSLARATLDRHDAMEALLELERLIGPGRALLVSHIGSGHTSPGCADVLAMHTEARRLVAELADQDARTRSALDTLRAEAHAGAQEAEAGEITLAAYRRVVAPPPSSAELVDRRG